MDQQVPTRRQVRGSLNMLVAADFIYVRLATGVLVYTAFAIDAFAGWIVG